MFFRRHRQNRKPRPPRSSVLRFESLESREMLTAVMLADIRAVGGSYPEGFTQSGGLTFFVANDGTHGQELWVTDGTPSGTELVADINPGASGSSPQSMLGIDGKLYFAANNGADGLELWVSDGTSSGTQLVADIETGATSSTPSGLTALSATTFLFAATTAANGEELYICDTTTNTVQLVKDIFSGATGSAPDSFVKMGNYIYFSASDSANAGRELWRTDGTDPGTQLVVDLELAIGVGSNPTELTVVDDQLFFAAETIGGGNELYVSDGTEIGTTIVRDIESGSGSSSPMYLTAVGDKLYFSATTTNFGREAWRTDGTFAGTEMLQDTAFGPSDSNPTAFAPAADGGFVLFATFNTIYRFEADAINSWSVAALVDSNEGMASGGGYLYFSRDSANGYEVYRQDDAMLGLAELVYDAEPGSGSSYPGRFAFLNNKLFFIAQSGFSGKEPWAYSAGPSISIDGLPGGNQGDEGTAVNVTASIDAPGAGGPYTYAWTVTKQGSMTPFATGTQSTLSFTPDDDGVYEIELQVTDSATQVGSAQANLTVDNVAPSVTIVGAPTSSFVDEAIHLTSIVLDPGALDTFSYEWTVKLNGQVLDTGTLPAFSYTPTEAGAYTFSLTVEDDEHGTDTQTAVVQMMLSPAVIAVKNIYLDVLGRPADAGGLAYWVNQINAGATPGIIAKAVMASDEYRQRLVESVFQQYLGRTADSGALTYWSNYLATGSELNFRVSILTSAEFRGGLGADAYIQKLYSNVLGRPAEAEAITFWKRELSNDPSGASVASALLQSGESYRKLVDGLYLQYLGRHVDEAGANYWTQKLQSGQVTLTSLVEKLVDSVEYSVT